MDAERNDSEQSNAGGTGEDGTNAPEEHAPAGGAAPTEFGEPPSAEPTGPSVPAVLKRSRVLVLAAAVVVLVVVLIAACGGDDEPAEAGAEDTTSVEIVDTAEDLAPEPSPSPEPADPVEPAPTDPAVDPAELPITKVKGKPLKRGMENKRVLQLQKSLIYLGYLGEGSADGKYGAKTKKAVQEFQLEQGLNGDGVAGPKTIRAINRAVKAAPAGGVSSSTSADAADDASADTADTGDGAEGDSSG